MQCALCSVYLNYICILKPHFAQQRRRRQQHITNATFLWRHALSNSNGSVAIQPADRIAIRYPRFLFFFIFHKHCIPIFASWWDCFVIAGEPFCFCAYNNTYTVSRFVIPAVWFSMQHIIRTEPRQCGLIRFHCKWIFKWEHWMPVIGWDERKGVLCTGAMRITAITHNPSKPVQKTKMKPKLNSIEINVNEFYIFKIWFVQLRLPRHACTQCATINVAMPLLLTKQCGMAQFGKNILRENGFSLARQPHPLNGIEAMDTTNVTWYWSSKFIYGVSMSNSAIAMYGYGVQYVHDRMRR